MYAILCPGVLVEYVLSRYSPRSLFRDTKGVH